MREIYYKEGEHIKSKEKYILNFFKSGESIYYPKTYYRDNNFIQCHEKYARSFDDLFWLFKSKFKTATKGELARIILNKNKSDVGVYYCDDIYKMVISKDKVVAMGFINNYNAGKRTHYMTESFVKEGPNFDKLLKYALRSKKFSLSDINLNPIKDYEKDLL
jgi:hypothetical protein